MNWLADTPANGSRWKYLFSVSAGPITLGPQAGTSVWLYQLRWFAVFGQLLTIFAAVLFYQVDLPLGVLTSLAGFTAATNIAYGLWLSWSHERNEETFQPQVAGLVMFVDLLLLTAMLYMTGGSANPFANFYFVNLAIAGVVLRPQWAWSLTSLAVCCYVLLTYRALPLPVLDLVAQDDHIRIVRLHGRVIAFSTCAAVITLFITRLANELTARQQALRDAQQQRDRSQRLEALATLAAGAAHELASPLSTIAVVAREMSHRLEHLDADGNFRKDMTLIDDELDHCKQILGRMRSSAGDSSAESWGRATLGDLMDATVDGVREPNRIEVELDADDESTVLWIPVQTVAQMIRNLLHNALDASPPAEPVVLTARVAEDRCRITVSDHGTGMSEEVLRRLGEPFFTTKEPGRGMGLGVFLTRNVVSRLGGNLEIDSTVGQGTRITMVLPRRMSQES